MPKTDLNTMTLAEALRPVLLRVGRELRREAREVGVSPEQVSLLVAIKYSPGIGVRELAARERVSPPALSNRVDRLEQDGLVARTPSDDDRRRVGLTLTDEGQRVLRRVRSRRTAWLVTRLGELSSDELSAIEAAVGPLTLLLDETQRP
ncbi:MAG TPA: MarR family transcriptional regulator [Gaiellaceae bacterium]|jgi:DNA-binding MarR family transcriptional regulator